MTDDTKALPETKPDGETQPSGVRGLLKRLRDAVLPAADTALREGLTSAEHIAAKPRIESEHTQAETNLLQAQEQQVRSEVARTRHRDQAADTLLAAEVETAHATARKARAEAMTAEADAWVRVLEAANKLREAGFEVMIDPDHGQIRLVPKRLPAFDDAPALESASDDPVDE